MIFDLEDDRRLFIELINNASIPGRLAPYVTDLLERIKDAKVEGVPQEET